MPTPDKRPLKVFLCHAHADRDAVRGLYTRLTKDGVDAWLDKEKLLPGQDWELEIRKAVREADVVVVCLSKQFNQAGFRQKEVRLALDTAMEQPEGEIFIIPARLEECDTIESLRKWHWVDLFEVDGYERLVRALQTRADKTNTSLRTGEKQTEILSQLKAEKSVDLSNLPVVDPWVNLVYSEWLNKRETPKFRPSISALIKKVNQLINNAQFNDILDLTEKIEALQKNFDSNGIHSEGTFFAHIECALASYRISMMDVARRHLKDAVSSTTNLHNKGVAYWLLGCICWLDVDEGDNAIIFWEHGLEAFKEMALRTPPQSELSEWYSDRVKLMSSAIEASIG
jgi:hypothetical protein